MSHSQDKPPAYSPPAGPNPNAPPGQYPGISTCNIVYNIYSEIANCKV